MRLKETCSTCIATDLCGTSCLLFAGAGVGLGCVGIHVCGFSAGALEPPPSAVALNAAALAAHSLPFCELGL
eukprot:12797696-Ditylum_brightwellii.AAC.1